MRVSPPTSLDGLVLTFDDGPDRRHTPALLEVLAQWGAPATFFLTGSQVPGCEDLVREAVDQGHQVGTHGFDHVDMTTLGEEELREQLETSCAVIAAASGQEVKLLRPPYGKVNEQVLRVAAGLGLDVVLWSVEGGDWEPVSASTVAQRVLDVAVAGDVVLLHDGRKDHLLTAEVVTELLGGLISTRLPVVRLVPPS
jgi:peptidoglycan/xylan/chitin deacetylase (PgdA/CDA1 family)